ncbi:DUF998 domain-containing protein [Halomicroarcula sp. GCM10025710]
MSPASRLQTSVAAGLASVVTTNVAILSAVVASPSFSWSENALSNLGQPGTAVATPVTTALFNGGLVLGGVLGVGFTVALWAVADNHVQRLAVPPFAGAMVAMVGVGVFLSRNHCTRQRPSVSTCSRWSRCRSTGRAHSSPGPFDAASRRSPWSSSTSASGGGGALVARFSGPGWRFRRSPARWSSPAGSCWWR